MLLIRLYRRARSLAGRLLRRLRGIPVIQAQAAAPQRAVTDLLTPAEPLNIRLDPALAAKPRLNVLLPGLAMHCMSGGPNTALSLAYRMAAHGVPVRYVATGIPPDPDHRPLWRHIMGLAGIHERFDHVEVVTGHDRSRPLPLGENDVFLATAWWTAQQAKSALPLMRCKKLLYLVQDFEPGLHAFSSHYALALDTYELDCYAIVNHRLLYDYFVAERVGRFGDPAFQSRCIVLDPAVDRAHFHPGARAAAGPRTLLFYARPNTAMRNLFELGVVALDAASARGAFDGADWRLLGIGDSFAPIRLSGGREIRSLPWMGFADYASRMRTADVLLSLMLSPHPSYPPLEMAASGGLVVTNVFGTKTAERLAELSPNILAARPSVESIADAVARAVARAGRQPDGALSAPASWDESFAPVLPFALRAWRECLAA